jgi:hypothetical protein
MLAVPDKRTEVSVSDAKVLALRVGTNETRGVNGVRGLLGDFSLQTRGIQAQALALHPTRPWRRDDRQGNRLGSAAQAVGERRRAEGLFRHAIV